jgi:L-threonylcarbamoyladenylate synthase
MRVSLSESLNLLKNGQVVALPTETVYGLAAALDNPEAIKKIFQLKGRPSSNPLIIHVGSIESILPFITEAPPHFFDLAEKFWPGPLTIILPIHTELVPEIARAALPTAGFRIPSHPLTLELLHLSPPVVMPSANISGKPSSTHPAHVENDFGSDFPVLDGGPCKKGVESTILYFDGTHWKMGRLGAIEPDLFIPVLGYAPQVVLKQSGQLMELKQPICPGQLFRHYAPKAKLLTDPRYREEVKFILGFRERNYRGDAQVICLGSEQDPYEVAENLFDALRRLDLEGASSAWVDMDFPRAGLWMTIAERLERAMER